jgi:hypothetical protein
MKKPKKPLQPMILTVRARFDLHLNPEVVGWVLAEAVKVAFAHMPRPVPAPERKGP